MRPEPVNTVPSDVPGGQLIQLKLDGFRTLAFALPEGPHLQSRSGGDLTGRFPELHAALAELPVGVVLDAEIVAWCEGRFEFGQLLRTPAGRTLAGAAVSLVTFDVLAVPVGRSVRDLRKLPLAERWGILTGLLADTRPPIEIVMSTRDRAEALEWLDRLEPHGVEGLVIKPLSGTYGGRGWLKYRRRDTMDAEAPAVIVSAGKPRALIVRLPDGRTLTTTPTLDALQAIDVAAAAVDRVAEARPDRGHGHLLRLAPPLHVEVRVGAGRHATARFVRVRGE